jgi:ornithine decarboxylase
MPIQANNHDLKQLNKPFYIFKPKKVKKNVEAFIKKFNGEAIYSVKTNPNDYVVKKIYDSGIRSFDVASLKEIKLIKSLFSNCKIYYMNPVKPYLMIQKSYFEFGVRDFSFDCNDELEKIYKATDKAKDLNLHIRISTHNNFSKVNLSKKFGIEGREASYLIRKASEISQNIGVSFHVGSQCLSPEAYKSAIRKVSLIVRKSGVKIKFLNIGGGFPGKYSEKNLPTLTEYFEKINSEFKKNFNYSHDVKLLSEPGRVLVYDCMSLVVKVILKKKKKLFINDGIHGHLSEIKKLGLVQPVRLFRKKKKKKVAPFSFYGPTCDSNDFLKGPYFLPESIKNDDYIEIDLMGAYTLTTNNDFNGFFSKPIIFIKE